MSGLCEKTELTLIPLLERKGLIKSALRPSPSLFKRKGLGDEFCDSHTSL